jgi:hypothetical protein
MTWVWRLCWKEYREHQMVWLVMAIGAALVVAGAMSTLAPLGIASPRSDPVRDTLTALILVMAIAYSAVCGGMLFAGERENRTQAFLDLLPVSRGAVWLTKTAFGLALVVAQALALFGIGTYYQLGFDPEFPWYGYLWLLLCLAVGAFCVACLTSSLSATVLPSVGLTALLLPVGVCTWGVLIPLALVASRQIYCRQDRQRRSGKARMPAALRKPWAWQTLRWLCWQQGRTLILILIPASAVGALIWPGANVFFWMGATALVGVACGTAVFAGEQMYGAERFLGEQRLPRWLVWLGKVGFWLEIMVWCFAILAGVVLLLAFFQHINFNQTQPFGQTLADRAMISIYIDPIYFLTVWMLYGFTIALFFGQILQKSAVAPVVALMASGLALLAWWPSLMCGGLHWWQIYTPPALLLAGSYFLYQPWVSGRLYTPRVALGMVGLLVGISVWIAGNLWYRSVEIPEIEEPFDRQAFLASLPAGEKNRAGPEIRDALERMTKHTDQVIDELWEAKPEAKENVLWEKSNAFHNELSELFEKEGEKVSPQMARTLDQMFADSWDGDLQKAVRLPPGMLVHPNQVSNQTYDRVYTPCRLAGTLWDARAVQLMEQKRWEEAWTYLHSSLLLARQCRSFAPDIGMYTGLGIEGRVRESLKDMLPQIMDQPRLLEQILSALQEQDQSYPPPSDRMKIDLLVWENTTVRYGGPPVNSSVESQMIRYAHATPWEKEREERQLRILAAAMIWMSEQPPETILNGASASVEPSARIKNALGLTIEGSPGRMLSETWVRRFFLSEDRAVHPAFNSRNLFQSQTDYRQKLRQTQLLVAQTLYEAREGQPPQTVADLVPKYLAAIPVDPTTGHPFPDLVQWEEKKLPEEE